MTKEINDRPSMTTKADSIKKRLINITWLKRENELKIRLLEHQATTPVEYSNTNKGLSGLGITDLDRANYYAQVQAAHSNGGMYYGSPHFGSSYLNPV